MLFAPPAHFPGATSPIARAGLPRRHWRNVAHERLAGIEGGVERIIIAFLDLVWWPAQ
ncbi:MAG: hypothetical protein AB7H53_07385 [Hyphomicrobium sp.]